MLRFDSICVGFQTTLRVLATYFPYLSQKFIYAGVRFQLVFMFLPRWSNHMPCIPQICCRFFDNPIVLH